MKFILASSSPRRARLMADAGLDFTVVKPCGAQEIIDPTICLRENAIAIALTKADHVARSYPWAPVIGADTIVSCDARSMGKPKDRQEALEMIGALAGREHEVITGVALVHKDRNITWTGAEVSKVRFRPISAEEAEQYVDSAEPMDKAGAYAIQGGAGKWVVSRDGSLANIIGLPVERLMEAIESLGYIQTAEGAGRCR